MTVISTESAGKLAKALSGFLDEEFPDACGEVVFYKNKCEKTINGRLWFNLHFLDLSSNVREVGQVFIRQSYMVIGTIWLLDTFLHFKLKRIFE